LAIYHGWLPLYSIAASFKAFGIEPDTDTTNLTPIHDRAAMRRRTVAARLPAVAFGVVFLVILFMAGKEMYGADAGWAALISAAIAVPMVNIARQARYYSLTACLSAGCCLAAWRMYARGRYRDFVVAGVTYALLFHTHLLTFAIASASLCLLLPLILKTHEHALRKLFLFGAIVAALTVPWLLMTGFLGAAQTVPKAVHTMKLPHDLIAWPLKYWEISSVMLAGMVWIALLNFRPKWFPTRVTEPFFRNRAAFFFLSGWILLGFFMFMLMIPAASLFFQRLYLGAVGPGIILGAILFVGTGRAIGGRLAVSLACIAFVAFAYVNTKAGYWWERHLVDEQRLADLMDNLNRLPLLPGTRVYATPNDHLTITFYTGIPVQSIAPIRKSFLDSYSGDIVLVDCMIHTYQVTEEMVRHTAERYQTVESDARVAAMTEKLNILAGARKIRSQVNSVVPLEGTLPPYASALLDWQMTVSPLEGSRYDFVYNNPAMFRGFKFNDFGMWWQIFFYRFVNPEQRIGDGLNYATRMRRGEARVLPTLWTIYWSPGLGVEAQSSSQMESK